MTKQEIIEALAKVENKRFMLSMKDRWNSNDYETDRQWFAEELALRKQLEVLG